MSEEKNKDENKVTPNTEIPKTMPDGTPVFTTIGRDFRGEGNDVSGYVGVDPEYRNYASQTDRPFTTDADVQAMLKSGQLTDIENLSFGVAAGKRADAVARGEFLDPANEDDDKDPDEEEEDDDEDEEDEPKNLEAPNPSGHAPIVHSPVKAAPAKATPAKAAPQK